jgi:hypothetical protein
MSTIAMYDTIEPGLIPKTAKAVAGYVGGSWPTYHLLAGMFPAAHHLSIAVQADEDAEALDIERLDATPAEVPGWARRQHARGIKRPVLYASASLMPTVIAACRAARITRGSVRLWSAHYTKQAHICGPAACAYPDVPACDGTQFTDTALGRNLDESLLRGDFFGHAAPPHAHTEDDMYAPLIPGAAPVTFTLWADTAAQHLPQAYKDISILLTGDTGATVITESWGDGKKLASGAHHLTTGGLTPVTPAKGTRVMRVYRIDTGTAAPAALEVFRY